jgi:hypothetical protein
MIASVSEQHTPDILTFSGTKSTCVGLVLVALVVQPVNAAAAAAAASRDISPMSAAIATGAALFLRQGSDRLVDASEWQSMAGRSRSSYADRTALGVDSKED